MSTKSPLWIFTTSLAGTGASPSPLGPCRLGRLFRSTDSWCDYRCLSTRHLPLSPGYKESSRCPPLSPGELLAAPHSPRPPGSGIPPNVTPTYQEGAEHPVTLPQPLWGPTPSLYSTLVLLDPFRVPLIASPFSILNVGPLALDRPLAGHPI